MSFINFNLNGDYGTKTTMRVGEEGGDSSKNGKNSGLYKDASNEETLFSSSEKESSYKITQSTKETGDNYNKIIKAPLDGTKTTMAVGEEGGDTSKITNSLSEMGIEVISKAKNEEGADVKQPLPGDGRKTTMAVGEEGGDRISTVNLEGGDDTSLTKSKNEEGFDVKQPLPGDGRKTTMAVGEEGGDRISTINLEGGDGVIQKPGNPKESVKIDIQNVAEQIVNVVMDFVQNLFNLMFQNLRK